LALLASTASCPAFVTISSRPSVGQDGEGYTGDLRLLKIRIFLQRALDRVLLICPAGKIGRLFFRVFIFRARATVTGEPARITG
jgi:hypothetical protein